MYRIGENIGNTSDELHIQNTLGIPITQWFKNGQRTLINISQRKTYKWTKGL
jgi:hypothetical protein